MGTVLEKFLESEPNEVQSDTDMEYILTCTFGTTLNVFIGVWD